MGPGRGPQAGPNWPAKQLKSFVTRMRLVLVLLGHEGHEMQPSLAAGLPADGDTLDDILRLFSHTGRMANVSEL